MSSRTPAQKVAQHFRTRDLKRICVEESAHFARYGERVDLPGQDRFYYYADNGADILFVAHLDSVVGERWCDVFVDQEAWPGHKAVRSPQLDDRLGAYIGLELLPRMGVRMDYLLTTDEERGRTTASEFAADFVKNGVPRKQYNWIISFDRGGDDVVGYQFDDPAWRKLVEASGARPARGSFSCIGALDELGCKAFNWGCGYKDYHSTRAYAWLDVTFQMVAHFMKFWRANKDVRIPHEYKKYTYQRYSKSEDWEGCSWYDAKSGRSGVISVRNASKVDERRRVYEGATPTYDEWIAKRRLAGTINSAARSYDEFYRRYNHFRDDSDRYERYWDKHVQWAPPSVTVSEELPYTDDPPLAEGYSFTSATTGKEYTVRNGVLVDVTPRPKVIELPRAKAARVEVDRWPDDDQVYSLADICKMSELGVKGYKHGRCLDCMEKLVLGWCRGCEKVFYVDDQGNVREESFG